MDLRNAVLVILLQPITQTQEGLVYLPSASFAQFGLASHPYIKFRHRDLMRAFFLHGDPAAALPYRAALAYQDRFAYLLGGTELYVLAHEVAHVRLGHLASEDHADLTPAMELQADALALEIVTEFFNQKADYSDARASLCAFMFLAINHRRFAHFPSNLLKSLNSGFAKSASRPLQFIECKGFTEITEPRVIKCGNEHCIDCLIRLAAEFYQDLILHMMNAFNTSLIN